MKKPSNLNIAKGQLSFSHVPCNIILSPVRTENVWRSCMIMHCLVTKYADELTLKRVIQNK